MQQRCADQGSSASMSRGLSLCFRPTIDQIVHTRQPIQNTLQSGPIKGRPDGSLALGLCFKSGLKTLQNGPQKGLEIRY